MMSLLFTDNLLLNHPENSVFDSVRTYQDAFKAAGDFALVNLGEELSDVSANPLVCGEEGKV